MVYLFCSIWNLKEAQLFHSFSWHFLHENKKELSPETIRKDDILSKTHSSLLQFETMWKIVLYMLSCTNPTTFGFCWSNSIQCWSTTWICQWLSSNFEWTSSELIYENRIILFLTVFFPVSLECIPRRVRHHISSIHWNVHVKDLTLSDFPIIHFEFVSKVIELDICLLIHILFFSIVFLLVYLFIIQHWSTSSWK